MIDRFLSIIDSGINSYENQLWEAEKLPDDCLGKKVYILEYKYRIDTLMRLKTIIFEEIK